MVKQLHELWRQHVTVPSASAEKVPPGQERTVEDTQCQEGTSEALPAQSSATEVLGWKNTLEAPSEMVNMEEEPGPSGWNLSFQDFKQVVSPIPTSVFPLSLAHPRVSPPQGLLPACSS